jgi:DNA-directed RNA polymerase specialized sigma24 family protein
MRGRRLRPTLRTAPHRPLWLDACDPAVSAFVRARGDHFTRSAVLLAGSPPEAEDLLQASLVQPYQAGPRLDMTGAAADTYLRKILVNTRRSSWRSRWRRGRQPR